MANFRKVAACLISYFKTSILALVLSIFVTDFFWPTHDADQQSSGPLEQQFYLLLVDQGYWMAGNFTSIRFKNGMTKQRRERFTKLLNDVRFKRDCLGGADRKDGRKMECTINGEGISFIDYGGH